MARDSAAFRVVGKRKSAALEADAIMTLTPLAISSVIGTLLSGYFLAFQAVAQNPATTTTVKQDPAITAAAYVLVISSVGGTVVLIITAWSGFKDRRESAAERLQALNLTRAVAASAEKTAEKTDTIVKATAQIHELTNSTNSNLQKALDVMTEKVAGLDKIIAEMRTAKAETAAAQTISDLKAAAAQIPAPSGLPIKVEMVPPPEGAPPTKVEMVNTEDDPANVKNIEPKK